MRYPKKTVQIISMLIGILIILPSIYLAYDRSLMPPAPVWVSPSYIPGETWEQYATRFLETSKKPNALEHYLKAFSLLTIEPNDNAWDSVKPILNNGWNKDYPKVENLLSRNQSAIQEILLGAKLQHCELPPEPFGEKAPSSSISYQKTQPLNIFIVLTGKKLEHENHFHKAMEYYLAGMQFGKDIGQKNQSAHAMRISSGVILNNVRPLLHLITSERLTTKDYYRIIQDLNKIEREQVKYEDEIEAFYQNTYTNHYRDTSHPIQYYKELPAEAKWQEFTGIRNYSELYCVGYIFFNRGRILADDYHFFQGMLSSATTKSFPESMVTKWNAREPQNLLFNIKIIEFLFGGLSSLQREVAFLRLAQLQAAMQLYRLEKKQWPKLQDDLRLYFQSIPLDPYTDKPFLWSRDSDNRAVAYSIGPDREDNAAKIVYDPTNGTPSNGDIF